MKIGDSVITNKRVGSIDSGWTGSLIGQGVTGRFLVRFDDHNEIFSLHEEDLDLVKSADIPDSARIFLAKAATTMTERGKEYDKPTGERSMARTVEAFNAITGQSLSESDGWLFMLILKQTRQWSTPNYHADSAIDSVAYAALLAESLAGAK